MISTCLNGVGEDGLEELNVVLHGLEENFLKGGVSIL
jgi:hypothetical protein